MIITSTRHGRSRRDMRNLAAHLNRQVGQEARVVSIGGVPLSNSDDALRYMEALRDGSRATVSCHHVALSPMRRLSPEQRDEAVQRILRAFGAEDHAFVLWEHDGKARSRAAADQHFHLVVSHVGPDGRAIDDAFSFRKLEAVARTIEHDFGEALTHSRRTASVAAELRTMGRADVADVLPTPPEPPQSSTSSRRRAAAERAGVDLPAAQEAVRSAWKQADGPAAFRSALAGMGFDVTEGRKPGVFVVSAGDAEIGALDRIVKTKRAAVAQRMKELDHAADPAPAPTGEIPDGRPEGGLRPEPGSEPSGPEARAAVELVGAAGGRDVADRAAAGDPGNHRPRTAPAPPLPRGPARKDGRHGRLQTARLNTALKGFRPTPETRAAAAEIHVRSFAGRFPALRSALLVRRLGGGLDRVRRLSWDLRSTISEIRLRIRFGEARPAEPIQVPEASTDLLRNRIREAQVSRRTSRPETEDPNPPGFRM
ncbi:hypothetical protein GTK01_20580 [Aliihoeflea sp. 40Bstr573]|nr:hypothetical protein [Aliihoeflea sp. 40Bstr573]